MDDMEQDFSSENVDSSVDSSVGNEGNDSSDSSENISTNPAWNDLLGTIPEEFHGNVKSHLSNWDKGVQNRFETLQQSYNPYKDFIENEIDPEILNQGYNLMNYLKEDPQGFYETLSQNLNLDGQSQGQDQFDVGDLSDNDEYDISNNPKFLEMQQQLEAQTNFISQFQAQQQQQALDQTVHSEMQEVINAYPNLNLDLLGQVALGMGQAKGEIPKLMEVADYLNSQMPTSNTREVPSAPPVINAGNRSFSTPAKKVGDMTDEERTAFIMSKLNG